MFKSTYIIKKGIGSLFFVFLLLSVPSLSFAKDAQEKLTPTAAPEVPAMDFTTEFNQLKVGAGISYLKIDDAFPGGDPLYIVTPGANFAFTKALTDKAGFSFGLGFYKQIIEDDSSDYDMDGSAMFFPFSASVAYRILGDVQSNNTMLFAGVNYSYVNMDLETGYSEFWGDYSYESDMTITGAAYGAMFGIKTKFLLSESFAILPFAAVQYTGSSMDYDVDTTTEFDDGSGNTTETTSSDSGSVDADPVRSLILGFDLLIGNFSIGTMLDALSSADGNKITVNASYTFKM